jgi:hypothetical protein
MHFLVSNRLFTELVFQHYQYKPVSGFSMGVGTKVKKEELRFYSLKESVSFQKGRSF